MRSFSIWKSLTVVWLFKWVRTPSTAFLFASAIASCSVCLRDLSIPMQEYPSASVMVDCAAKAEGQASRKRTIQAVIVRNQNMRPPSNTIR